MNHRRPFTLQTVSAVCRKDEFFSMDLRYQWFTPLQGEQQNAVFGLKLIVFSKLNDSR